ncbi:C-type lectin domain family 6 member A-like isoform X4 [Myotis daubentonii]|uniref:C-type lectin domain family 6 member A-like isoform X4 n=1 Tax=Myotis daubentonii TaxID=98922 RepID=UPI00287398C4|nr:C-type lectin domain family 6 member A-like isoform X4 [Myotis daubentonii]
MMVQQGQSQGRVRPVWWSPVKIWSVAVVSIAFLSACFIVSCVATYHITYTKTIKRLSELHTYHPSLTCFNEGTRVTEKVWGCCPSTWKSFGSSCYFISKEDPQGNGNWQWIDQTPYTENVKSWHEGEPNFSAEECASVVFWNPKGWGWNDVFCDSKRNSICEMNKLYL